MIKTTISALALGTFAFTTGASAVSLHNQSALSKPLSISSDRLLAQYNSPGQYYPQRPYSPRSSFPQRYPSNPPRYPSKPQADTSKPQADTSKPQSDSSKPQSDSSKPQGGSSDTNAASIEQSVFEQINQYRQSQNLPVLSRNSTIDTQARNHSQNMASGKVPFSHQGFQERVQAVGIPHQSASENVAYNQDRDPATQAVQSWLKSPGHLANIKGNSNLTGIGVAINGQGVVYLTQLFFRT